MRRFGALLLLTITLLAGCGVLTAIPLLLFSAAANRISLTVIGFIQYVSPTIALVLAVAFFGEQFTMAHGICFALIWLGIAAIGAEAAWTGRRKRAAEAARGDVRPAERVPAER